MSFECRQEMIHFLKIVANTILSAYFHNNNNNNNNNKRICMASSGRNFCEMQHFATDNPVVRWLFARLRHDAAVTKLLQPFIFNLSSCISAFKLFQLHAIERQCWNRWAQRGQRSVTSLRNVNEFHLFEI